MKIEIFIHDPKKRSVSFHFENDPIENQIKNFEVFEAQLKKKISNPDTILEQNLQFSVVGYGSFNSLIHYILVDNFSNCHLFTWNEFRQMENLILEEERIRNID